MPARALKKAAARAPLRPHTPRSLSFRRAIEECARAVLSRVRGLSLFADASSGRELSSCGASFVLASCGRNNTGYQRAAPRRGLHWWDRGVLERRKKKTRESIQGLSLSLSLVEFPQSLPIRSRWRRVPEVPLCANTSSIDRTRSYETGLGALCVLSKNARAFPPGLGRRRARLQEGRRRALRRRFAASRGVRRRVARALSESLESFEKALTARRRFAIPSL